MPGEELALCGSLNPYVCAAGIIGTIVDYFLISALLGGLDKREKTGRTALHLSQVNDAVVQSLGAAYAILVRGGGFILSRQYDLEHYFVPLNQKAAHKLVFERGGEYEEWHQGIAQLVYEDNGRPLANSLRNHPNIIHPLPPPDFLPPPKGDCSFRVIEDYLKECTAPPLECIGSAVLRFGKQCLQRFLCAPDCTGVLCHPPGLCPDVDPPFSELGNADFGIITPHFRTPVPFAPGMGCAMCDDGEEDFEDADMREYASGDIQSSGGGSLLPSPSEIWTGAAPRPARGRY